MIIQLPMKFWWVFPFHAFTHFNLIQNTLKVIKKFLNFIYEFHQFIWKATFPLFPWIHTSNILKVIKTFLNFIFKFHQFIQYVPTSCGTNSHFLWLKYPIFNEDQILFSLCEQFVPLKFCYLFHVYDWVQRVLFFFFLVHWVPFQ